MTASLVSLSPLANVEWRSDAPAGLTPVLCSPDTGRLFEISPGVARFLIEATTERSTAELASVAEADGLTADQAEALIADLVASGVLVERAGAEAYRHWLDMGWRHAARFHVVTRNQEFLDMGQPNEDEVKIASLRSYTDVSRLDEFYKDYGDYVPLPAPRTEAAGSAGAGEVLARRRTSRRFQAGAELGDVASVLYYGCQAATCLRDYAQANRDDQPLLLLLSSYAPLECYLVAQDVSGLVDGLYHYSMPQHGLHLLRAGTFGSTMRRIAIGQVLDQCALTVILTTRFPRYMWRYRSSRAYRNVYIEAGSMAQRFLVISEALGLATFLTPAVRDSVADDLLEVDGYEESICYVIGVGRPTS